LVKCRPLWKARLGLVAGTSLSEMGWGPAPREVPGGARAWTDVPAECPLPRLACGRRHAGDRLLAQAGDPDLEELVEVPAEDGEKLARSRTGRSSSPARASTRWL
jgi:hypothetical protein